MSIKKNFLYSSILTTAGYLFPLITYPYVSRVLGVNNIGICNFVDSIINYFILFSMMGIRTIGIREIAKCQGDKHKMSQTFSDLLILNFIFVIIFGLALIISIQIVPIFAEHKVLMYVGVAKLLSTFLLVEWLYKGVEDFKFITKRSIIVRCIYVVAVFIFVRDANDYIIYFVLLVLTEGINAIVNCIHSRKYVRLSLKKLNPFKYIKSSVTLGCYGFLTNMYTTFNVAYLGFVSTTTEVGFYTTATKLHHIILALFSAFTGVMLPRMSNLASKGNMKEFKHKINQSFLILIYFSFPIIVLGVCFSPEIIRVIAGSGYEKASTPLVIVMPLIFIIGLEQVIIQQILMPLNKDRAILINSIVGALIGLIANLLLVKSYGCIGSSVVWFIAELGVLLSSIYFVFQCISLHGLKKSIIVNIGYAIPAFLLCIGVRYYVTETFLRLIMSSILVFVYYIFLHVYIIKDNIIISLVSIKFR